MNVINIGISRKTLKWGDLPGRAISNSPQLGLWQKPVDVDDYSDSSIPPPARD